MIPQEILKNKYRLLALENIHNNQFQGSTPPGLFVGEYNYPNVNVSIVSPTEIIENAKYLDTSEQWYGLPLHDFIAMRQQLVHAGKKFETVSASSPGNELQGMQEMLMSKHSLAIDVQLLRPPVPRVSFDDMAAPTGPSAYLKQFSLEENPQLEKHAQKAYYDTDLKAQEAVLSLYGHGQEVSQLSKLLSAGVFGINNNRKLVPTKWSITATDDMVSKYLMDEIRYFPLIETIQVFESNYLDNHFLILLMPSAWSFEMMESWLKFRDSAGNPKVSHDFEKFEGRTKYADSITGAYYSARLAVAEYLHAQKKQAAVLVLREIGPAYEVPVGVWEVRENCRHAFHETQHSFQDLRTALQFISGKLKNPIATYKQRSMILDQVQNQRRITQWMG